MSLLLKYSFILPTGIYPHSHHLRHVLKFFTYSQNDTSGWKVLLSTVHILHRMRKSGEVRRCVEQHWSSIVILTPPYTLLPLCACLATFLTSYKKDALLFLISPCQGRHGKYLKNYSRKFHVGVLASAWDLRHFVMPRISLCISESACFRQSGTVQGSSHSELPCELPLVSLLQIVPENVRNCKNGHIGRWPNAVRRRY